MVTVTVAAILDATAAHFRLEVADLVGNAKRARLVQARHVAIYLARELTNQSYPAIGRALRRDHATVMYACAQVRRAIAEGRRCVEDLAAIREALGRPLPPVLAGIERAEVERRMVVLATERDAALREAAALRATLAQIRQTAEATP